jgi:hypothetical protein
MDTFLVRRIYSIQVKIELELNPYSFIIKKKREREKKYKTEKKELKKKIHKTWQIIISVTFLF